MRIEAPSANEDESMKVVLAHSLKFSNFVIRDLKFKSGGQHKIIL